MTGKTYSGAEDIEVVSGWETPTVVGGSVGGIAALEVGSVSRDVEETAASLADVDGLAASLWAHEARNAIGTITDAHIFHADWFCLSGRVLDMSTSGPFDHNSPAAMYPRAKVSPLSSPEPESELLSKEFTTATIAFKVAVNESRSITANQQSGMRKPIETVPRSFGPIRCSGRLSLRRPKWRWSS